MRIIIDNFFQLSAQNAGELVVSALLAIYAGLVLVSLFEIATRKRGLGFKLFWGLVVLLAPFVGMAFYSIFCLCTADYPLLEQLGVKTTPKKSETKKPQRFFST